MTPTDADAADEGQVIADALVEVGGEVAALVHEHQEDFGEILSTLLLDRLAVRFVEVHQQGEPERTAVVDRAVAVVARLHEIGDDDMQTAVVTGFLEALPSPGRPGRAIVELLPPALREELRAMEDAVPPR